MRHTLHDKQSAEILYVTELHQSLFRTAVTEAFKPLTMKCCLLFDRHHLERVLDELVIHYNQARPHRGIDLDAPIPLQPVRHTFRPIERVDRLGGLIHEYLRAA